MLAVKVETNQISFGERFSLLFLRTLRVPEDGNVYPLPPGLGEFTLHRAREAPFPLAEGWEPNDVFLCMYQREALWLGFEGATWKPNAVQVHLGTINAVTGEPSGQILRNNPQNYLVCPPQPWLDGVNTSSGVVRQFVAVPLGLTLTVESQLAAEEMGGLQITVFEPRKGYFPDTPPPRTLPPRFQTEQVQSAEMGLAAGGEISQKIYEDPYGLEAWDSEEFASVRVRILNSVQYSSWTGSKPPPTPIDARTYTQCGFPWYQIYDEHLPSLPTPERLRTIKSLREIQKTDE